MIGDDISSSVITGITGVLISLPTPDPLKESGYVSLLPNQFHVVYVHVQICYCTKLATTSIKAVQTFIIKIAPY